jgi:hypothetical protein
MTLWWQLQDNAVVQSKSVSNFNSIQLVWLYTWKGCPHHHPLLTFESSTPQVHHQIYNATISSHNCERWRSLGHSNIGTQCSKHAHDLILLPFLIIRNMWLAPMAINGTWFGCSTPIYIGVVQPQSMILLFQGLSFLWENKSIDTWQDIISISATCNLIMFW